MNIDKRVMEIRNNKALKDEFIKEYYPFINATVARKTGLHITGVETEYYIGISAFAYAIENYTPKKGTFLTFAASVIHSRLAAHIRSEKKVLLPDDEDEFGGPVSQQQQERRKSELFKIEFYMFANELECFNISLDRLIRETPKRKSLKQLYNMIASYIVSDREMLEQILTRGNLPSSQLAKNIGISKRRIEKGHDYIIASIIIINGDYKYLKKYVKIGVRECE